ncbi:MAG: VOC family protein [Actinomycetota bacterium]
MENRVERFEIAATDLKGLKVFYEELFGWAASSDNPSRYSLVEPRDGIKGLIFKADPGVPTFVTIYVEVEDVEQQLKRAEQLGGTIYVPATQSPVPGERCFGVFGDPEGNIIGVCQRD